MKNQELLDKILSHLKLDNYQRLYKDDSRYGETQWSVLNKKYNHDKYIKYIISLSRDVLYHVYYNYNTKVLFINNYCDIFDNEGNEQIILALKSLDDKYYEELKEDSDSRKENFILKILKS